MDDERVAMQERGLKALHDNGGFKFTDRFFTYTSGEIGPYYVQSGVVMRNGDDYATACEDLGNLISPDMGGFNAKYDQVAGGESRDWIFSQIMAYEFGKPHVMLYKNGKMVGADDMEGKRIALVCDLNNEGSSPRDKWVPAINGAGGSVSDIFFYVDRMESGVQVMKDLGLNSQAVVPLDDHAWEYLQGISAVQPEEYEQLVARGTSKADRDKWAVSMLQTQPGLHQPYL